MSNRPPRRPTRRFRWGLRLLALALGLLVGLLATEMITAGLPLPQRIQVIRERPGLSLTTRDGVPVWRSDRSAGLRPDCEERPIHVYGSSILRGVRVPDAEVFSRRLGDDACLRNFAEAGYAAQTNLAVAKERVPAERPVGIIWEVWRGSPGAYTAIGPAAYKLMGAPPPEGLTRLAFIHSRAVEYAWLARLQIPRPDRLYADYLDGTLPELRALAAEHGAELLFVLCPSLSRPLAESATRREPLYDIVRELEVPMIDLAAELADRDVSALRLDPCCHWNADGHAAIAELLRPWVRSLADTGEPPADQPTSAAIRSTHAAGASSPEPSPSTMIRSSGSVPE